MPALRANSCSTFSTLLSTSMRSSTMLYRVPQATQVSSALLGSLEVTLAPEQPRTSSEHHMREPGSDLLLLQRVRVPAVRDLSRPASRIDRHFARQSFLLRTLHVHCSFVGTVGTLDARADAEWLDWPIWPRPALLTDVARFQSVAYGRDFLYGDHLGRQHAGTIRRVVLTIECPGVATA